MKNERIEKLLNLISAVPVVTADSVYSNFVGEDYFVKAGLFLINAMVLLSEKELEFENISEQLEHRYNMISAEGRLIISKCSYYGKEACEYDVNANIVSKIPEISNVISVPEYVERLKEKDDSESFGIED